MAEYMQRGYNMAELAFTSEMITALRHLRAAYVAFLGKPPENLGLMLAGGEDLGTVVKPFHDHKLAPHLMDRLAGGVPIARAPTLRPFWGEPPEGGGPAAPPRPQ